MKGIATVRRDDSSLRERSERNERNDNMLAKFENGNILEVIHKTTDTVMVYECGKYVEKEIEVDELVYTVYDENGDDLYDGWTEYRDLSKYPGLNEIDYIIKYCEPNGVEDEYEFLPYNDIEAYFSPTETPDGEWLLERKGAENDIRTYSRFDEAQRVMQQEYLAVEASDMCCFSDNALVAGEEYYQHWQIDRKEVHSNLIDEKVALLQKELDRAQLGVSQYTYELMDTSVIRDHLDKMETMLEELKELLKG